VAAAKLPKQGQEWEAGEASVVSGWGTLSSGGQSSDVLMKVEVPIVSDSSKFAFLQLLDCAKQSLLLGFTPTFLDTSLNPFLTFFNSYNF
jgi:hypothetical protein